MDLTVRHEIDEALESRLREFGRHLCEATPLSVGWLEKRIDALMRQMTSDPTLRIQALRFIDVLPVLCDDEGLLRHLREYFSGLEGLPWPMKAGLAVRPLQGPLLARTVRRAAKMLSKRFIAGADSAEVLRAVAALRRREIGFSLDLLGEAVLGDGEADRYLHAYLHLMEEAAPQLESWPERARLDRIDGRAGPRLYLSLKLTSLCPRIEAADPEGSIADIARCFRPLLQSARRHRAFVCVDMEQYEYKEVLLDCFKTLLAEPEFRDWPDVGIALQAYLRDTEADLHGLIDWARRRGTPVTVRLVRGAYWDYETIVAGKHGWPVPVWMDKAATDACYERCMELLMGHADILRPAIATHNLRSLAKGMALAERYGVSAESFEFQMLYGMATRFQAQLARMGYCLRIYMPFGEPIPGMAYLVRRLLENASSQTLVFPESAPEDDPERLFAPPRPPEAGASEQLPPDEEGELPPFRNEAPLRFVDHSERDGFAAAVARGKTQTGGVYPLIIDGEAVDTGRYIESVNPARPEEVIGRVAMAGREEAERAVAGAAEAAEHWAGLGWEARARVMLRAAQMLRSRRAEFAAREILEAGKTWREADANITETIDFLEYYPRQALRLGAGRRVDVSGERNFNGYRPLGVGVVIPPWNFPSAILTGMLSAALVTGNAAILKPSTQTPLIAAHLVALLRDAGVPDGVLQFLPGPGGEVGEYLVRHPGIHFVAFTGSEAVGSRIIRLAAQRADGQHHVKRVVAEMGGKNAIIVDADADPDEVVKGVIRSAFGYQGQKCSACSRLILVGAGNDTLLKRLAEAAASVRIGMPEDPGVFMGPVIERAARDRILAAVARGRDEAELLFRRDCSDLGEGFFMGPVIFSGAAPDSSLAREEIFGPVLTVFRVPDLNEAVDLANDSRYALTGGFYSRSPAHIEWVKRNFAVGNLYINRGITGALVERQAFGGFKLSGLGFKAGGPDYLLQFLNQSTWTENTLRHGFAPA